MITTNLVIGSAGFIGARLCESLLAQGGSVIGIDSFDTTLYPSDKRKTEVKKLQRLGLNFVEADAAHIDFKEVLDGVDTVYNLAAVPGLLPSWSNFEAYMHSNVFVVNNLLQALVSFPGVHLIHASTSSVQGSQAVPGSDEAPNSPYGVSKLAAEKLIQAYGSEFGTPYSILRYFSVYGPNPRPDQFFAIIMDQLEKREPITIYGDGLNRRTNTYLDDVVKATILAGTARMRGLIAPITGSESATALEIVDLVAEKMGVAPKLNFDAPRPGDQRSTRGDPEIALSAFGWEASTTIAIGIEKMVEVFLKQKLSESSANHE